MTQFNFEGIGTHWRIDIKQELTAEKEKGLLRDIQDRIKVFDKDYSRFRDDSLVMQMAKKKGVYRLPEDGGPMMNLYLQLYRLTGGKFTPLIGRTLEQAGYDKDYSLSTKKMEATEKWEEVMEWKEPILKMKKTAVLDFGAGGKGYLIDIVAELLKTRGVSSFCVDAGGDIAYSSRNKEELRVGLESPIDQSEVIGVASITGGSICGSAGTRRKWGEWHHIIDPDKLKSPREVVASWVVAETTMLADSIATCLFLVPPMKLKKEFKFEYAVVNSDMSLDKSGGFPAEFFLA